MPSTDIVIRGAREHNLRDVDLDLPRRQLICLTGVSGSGKSSLAFDTLFAEGQRRYVESLSTFARQFMGQMPKPDVDKIDGLSPAISISQKTSGTNPRSTVGTVTEIHDYLRVLYARVAQGYCPQCDQPIAAQSIDHVVGAIAQLPVGQRVVILAPLVRGQKGQHRDVLADLRREGFSRVRIDGRVVPLDAAPELDRKLRHDIEVVVDRIELGPEQRSRLAEAVETAVRVGAGHLIVDAEAGAGEKGVEERGGERSAKSRRPSGLPQSFSTHYACASCGESFDPPSPQLFSFNSPRGMCRECDGLGEQYTFDPQLLVPDGSKSLREGGLTLLGGWKELGRWRRHIWQGVADTIERVRGLEAGTMLDTAWGKLPADLQQLWLWGTGTLHITFTWRGGQAPMKYGGHFAGLVPELLERYRGLTSATRRRQLEAFMAQVACGACGGSRLNRQARSFRLESDSPRFAGRPRLNLPEYGELSIAAAVEFVSRLKLDATRQLIADDLLKEVRTRLQFLLNVGLDYLTLNRTAPTLSGGESQRIRLASQIGSGLVGVLYVLDEPSIGLHARDNRRLIDTLRQLRDLGNTVVVVEHDEETIRSADCVVDFGPGPGAQGGQVVAQGSPDEVAASESLTGQFLAGRRSIAVPSRRRRLDRARVLRVINARHHNLRGIDVEIPLGGLICITGVSGSGKSSLVNDVLAAAIRERLHRGVEVPGAHDRIEGLEGLDKLIAIDQSPIGRTPRSNPATYIKLFDEIRGLYAQLPDARQRGFKPGRFSFNVKSGRCEACEGNGANKLEMDFLADLWVTCPVCQGQRFSRETLQVRFKGKSISDVLEMDVDSACGFFENVPKIVAKLRTLQAVGLGYIRLGQPSPTLSGGEAQRVKLAREFVKRNTGRTLYLLDEPTTGLHFADVELLLSVLHSFVDGGNTVLVVEHHLDVIKTADWVIDLGPEGGEGGGELVAAGTPEDVAACERSPTGRALREVLAAVPRRVSSPAKRRASRCEPDRSLIRVRGACQHNLRHVDADLAREKMTVFCGPSGSGKSSLAMDTIYAEGQRRYVESLSAYARQFVHQMQKPRVEQVDGLSPAIAIEQKNLGNTPRSTVGTVTEVYDFLRVLMARLGTPYCPVCDVPIGTQTADQIVDKLLALPSGSRLYLLAPLAAPSGDPGPLWEELRREGFARVRINGQTHGLDELPAVDRRQRWDLAVVIDRAVVRAEGRGRLADSVETALAVGRGVMQVAVADERLEEPDWPVQRHSLHLACGACGASYERLSPHHFSFNSPLGWCPDCQGLGVQVGADPAFLLRTADATLREGVLRLWPSLDLELARAMLTALGDGCGLPLDVPFSQLDARHKRLLFYGCGDRRFPVPAAADRPAFSFQYKGLFPAVDEAARLVPMLRHELSALIGEVDCGACFGSRLRPDAAAARFQGRTLDGICRLPLASLRDEVAAWALDAREQKIAGEILREIRNRLQFLCDVGLEYLTLGRAANSLSNGEAQRIRLASQLGSGLCGVLYVLDEPTVGLHPRDNRRLLTALQRLRDLGNTLLVVEHDREVIAAADEVCDFGPRAGSEGGRIVAQAPPAELADHPGSVTGPYLTGSRAIVVPAQRRPVAIEPEPLEPGRSRRRRTPPPIPRLAENCLEVVEAEHHNLKRISVQFPLRVLTAVTGPSGCGKSSLVNDVLFAALARRLHRATTAAGVFKRLVGVRNINKVIRVDQTPLGNSPTSTPATYTGAFDLIREWFARLPEARLRGFTSRRFSFNVPGGRCEECQGNGQRRIEMHFLPDVWVPCESCQGRRYNAETLAVTFQGHSIHDVLEMSCREAAKLFAHQPLLARILETLCDVGLDYVRLGQSAPTLSGGEAQRVKLAAELARPDTGQTLYLLDEPTTGLHFDDLQKLLRVLHRLVDLGNTVVVIEHNLDVIKSADWVIDLGPEAGAAGGEVVVCGTPEDVAAYARRAVRQGLTRSHTGEFLDAVLRRDPRGPRGSETAPPAAVTGKGLLRETPSDEALTPMPWEADGRGWHLQTRVDRAGQPLRWDGRILADIVDRLERRGGFTIDWSHRSVVEVSAPPAAGWFLHALTGDTWVLKLKFRVRNGIFHREALQEQLPLKTFNQLDEIPRYGNQPRLRLRRVPGGRQEIELQVALYEEIDRPEFWSFLERAVAGYLPRGAEPSAKLAALTPWARLGEAWHRVRRGFLGGRAPEWDAAVLDRLVKLLRRVAPQSEFDWQRRQVVHVRLASGERAWASFQTKKPDAVWLHLRGPHGRFAAGRVADLCLGPSLSRSRHGDDLLHLPLRTVAEIENPRLCEFLREHLAAVRQPSPTS